MKKNEIINQLVPIIEEIVPASEVLFRENFYRIYAVDINDENLNLVFTKFSNRLLENEFPKIKDTFPDFFNGEKYTRWYLQIHSVLFEDILKNITENPKINNQEKIVELDEVINMLKDLKFFHPYLSEYLKGFIDYCERKIASLDLTNSKIVTTYLYYWPYSSNKFNELEGLLEEEKIIEHNPNFLDSFHKFKSLQKNRTTWKLKQRDLFAMLYLIYNKQSSLNNEDIRHISLKLFKLTRETKNENTRTNFNKFIKKINEDPNSIYDDHYQISTIIQDLHLRQKV